MDCQLILLIKVEKTDDNRFAYCYTTSAKLPYSDANPSVGWLQLVSFLQHSPEELGWVNSELNFSCGTVSLIRLISMGRTSIVYKGKFEDKEVAVKMAKSD